MNKEEKLSFLMKEKEKFISIAEKTKNLGDLWKQTFVPYLSKSSLIKTQKVTRFLGNMDSIEKGEKGIWGFGTTGYKDYLNSIISGLEKGDLKTIREIIEISDIKNKFNLMSSKTGTKIGDLILISTEKALEAKEKNKTIFR